MQRFFSDFPSAFPGLGLLLLRAVLAVFLLVQGVTRAAGALDAANPHTGMLVCGVASIVLAIPVAFGFLTPIVATFAAVVESLPFVFGVVPLTADRWPVLVLVVGVALTLALIGPGAYSIDSRLFGRREIVIPPRPDNAQSGRRRSPPRK